MNKNEKVLSITKDNYKDVVDRASALRKQLTAHYHKYKGFPSLSYVINVWGYTMSLKALCRHRKQVMVELGLTEVGKPTHTHRTKRLAKTVEPATLQTETPKVDVTE